MAEGPNGRQRQLAPLAKLGVFIDGDGTIKKNPQVKF